MFEGTFRKYHKLGESDHLFRKATEAAEAIISSGKYSIYTTGNPNKDYESLHTQNDLKGNPEMIFFRQYDNVQVSHPGYPIRIISVNNGGFTKDMVEDYLCTDGKPIRLSSEYLGDQNFEDEVNPRLTVALWGYGSSLFIYAEAKTELGGCTQTDIDNSINLLRKRVGMPDMIIDQLVRDPDSDMTIAAGYLEQEVPVLLEEIRRERRIELACEGFRRNDLLRWKAGKFYEKTVLGAKWSYFLGLKDVTGEPLYTNESLGKEIWINTEGFIEPYQNTLPQGRKFDPAKHYFLPIPIIELSLNPALKQNPNW